MSTQFDVLIIGGGTAGLTVAAQLLDQPEPPTVGIVEPSDEHYYQPIWTLVGAGVFDREISVRNEEDFIPHGAEWIKAAATGFDPENNSVTVDSGATIGYNMLVVCPGLQHNWDEIPGLKDSLGSNGICSNYSFEHVPYTWEALQAFQGGRAIFTTPATPIQCGGAPQKIMYLAADHWRIRGVLNDSNIRFMTPGTVIFGVPEFARTLKKVAGRYGIDFEFGVDLAEIRTDQKQAVFRILEEGEQIDEKVLPFDFIHVTPRQSAPDFIKESPLAAADGWVDVDKHTLQHTKFDNVFGLGDVTNTPNAKTGAAVRKQAPIVVHHLMQVLRDGRISDTKSYNGYSSCPLITGYGRLILAEFDYENRPDPSFPFDTTQERYSMYALKAYGLPRMYWHGMLRGRA